MSTMDTIITAVLTVFFWAVQIGITAVIALLLGLGLKKLESALRRKPGHLLPWTFCTFTVLCAVLAALALNPPVVCPDEYKDELTPEINEAVQSVSRGIYSKRLPLVPACARITEIEQYEKDGESGHTVYFDIHYLYFGRQGMSWAPEDTYNIEKQLFGY